MKRKLLFLLMISAMGTLIALGARFPKDHDDRGDLLVPESWRGTWEVKVTYRDHETGALVETVTTTGPICPGEPIVPKLTKIFACAGEAEKKEMEVLCGAKHSPRPGCNVFVEADLESVRDGDDWRGTGRWNAKVVGNCGHETLGENFTVKGKRLSPLAECDQKSSLLERFFPHTELVFVLGGKLI